MSYGTTRSVDMSRYGSLSYLRVLNDKLTCSSKRSEADLVVNIRKATSIGAHIISNKLPPRERTKSNVE